MADDNSTIILRQYLNNIGYSAHGWGLMLKYEGSSAGSTGAVREMQDELQQKVGLISWSLGGILSGEIARDHP